jgi:hypothetical protein
MGETLKSAVAAAALRLLEPLVKLLLEAGIGVGEFHQLAKRAYVNVARERAGESKPNVSRIAVLTGITRAEVAALLALPASEGPAAERGRHRAERVLHGWWHDAEFLARDGGPAILPLRGPKRSFVSLVRRYAGDPRVATLLEELVRVKAVRRRTDGQLEVLSRTFVTARWDPEGIGIVGERVHDLLETLVYNLKNPGAPRFERFVVRADVQSRYVPMLLRDIGEQADVLADSLQDALNDPERRVSPASEPQDARRVGLAIFVVDDPATVPASAAGRGGGRGLGRKAAARKAAARRRG